MYIHIYILLFESDKYSHIKICQYFLFFLGKHTYMVSHIALAIINSIFNAIQVVEAFGSNKV